MAGSFVIETARNKKFKFNLRAGNHQVILTSELYEAKASATDSIESVRKNAAEDARFVRKTARDGSAYFVLTASNGEVIAQSEMYTTAAAMEKGIASVRANAAAAKVVDKTK